ncbi:YciI family protein [Myceligenerans indicum]|uniref:YCII-related domain-containing protein n=1 Tax=Myceligenerans indicum TaxID=2593663 RepID=A0ABS1LHD4_9MICO|nr:YciI family protein [Myceligenerans indicum]MBL0885640.1 hypothetical protein [Myceligenerans indicum]
MTDTWVFLIREPDWDSDSFLPENMGGRARQDVSGQMAAHARFQDAVAELDAKIVDGKALQNSKYGGWVTVGKDGADPVWTDAPFADSSEVITGFYAVECDEESARRIAALVPSNHVVEWRKVMNFGD